MAILVRKAWIGSFITLISRIRRVHVIFIIFVKALISSFVICSCRTFRVNYLFMKALIGSCHLISNHRTKTVHVLIQSA